MHRSTYRGQLRRFWADRLAGLHDKRPPLPPTPLKATPAICGVIGAMRLADHNIPVEHIAEVLAGRFGTTLSPAVVKRVLKEEGLNRPRGGGRGFQPAKSVEAE